MQRWHPVPCDFHINLRAQRPEFRLARRDLRLENPPFALGRALVDDVVGEGSHALPLGEPGPAAGLAGGDDDVFLREGIVAQQIHRQML